MPNASLWAFAQGAVWAVTAAGVWLYFDIGRTDFLTQKISNRKSLYVLIAALVLHTVYLWVTRDPGQLVISAVLSAVIFTVLFIFWLLDKVGAGDVKLMAATVFLMHPLSLFPFMVAFAVAILAVVALMKFPVVLPEWAFRTYLKGLSDKGRLPFGVPISAAAILGLLYSAYAGFWLGGT